MTLKTLLIKILPQIPERKIKSLAHGVVKIIKCEKDDGNKITVEDIDGVSYEYDENGRLSRHGQTLLYPDHKDIQDWFAYEKWLLREYNTNLSPGDICLVKETSMSDWVLAIYEGPGKARVSRDIKSWSSWMRYKGNEDYLGRAIIPEWMQ
jgi:hypothetical protein